MSRELDAKVGKLLGWTFVGSDEQQANARKMAVGIPPDKPHSSTIYKMPHYTTDASADYLVLEYVREKWMNDGQMRRAFCDYLVNSWGTRAREDGRVYNLSLWMPCYYRPGDYSLAALAVVNQSADSP